MADLVADRPQCQRCAQGWVLPMVVIKLDREIWICDECDAVWPSSSAALDGLEWVDFATMMAIDGLPGLWEELAPTQDRPLGSP